MDSNQFRPTAVLKQTTRKKTMHSKKRMTTWME